MPSLAEITKNITSAFSKSNPRIVLNDKNSGIKRLSTGCYKLDNILGGTSEQGYGVPYGRIIELFSAESGSKSSIALSICAQSVKMGRPAVYLDLELTFDPVWAKAAFGLEIGDMFQVLRPVGSEQLLSITNKLMNLDDLGVLVLDSTAAVLPDSALDYNPNSDNRQVGSGARANQDFIVKTLKLSAKFNTAVILISQVRANIVTNKYDPMANQGTGSNGAAYQDTKITTGGTAPRFYSSIRLRLEFGGRLEDSIIDASGEATKIRSGVTVRATGVKNKTGAPFLRGSFNFYYNNHTIPAPIHTALNKDEVLDFNKITFNLQELNDNQQAFKNGISKPGFSNAEDFRAMATNFKFFNYTSVRYTGSPNSPVIFAPIGYGQILLEEWKNFAKQYKNADNKDNWCILSEVDGNPCLKVMGPKPYLYQLLSYHPVFQNVMLRILRKDRLSLEEVSEGEIASLSLDNNTTLQVKEESTEPNQQGIEVLEL